jgi:peptidoglycan/xylan/chitin deacetylase (PgdA/CDA1 family)
VQPRRARRLRWSVKSALASTIAFAHQRGLAAALARGPERPLVVCYHRVVDDFEAAARTEMRSMLTSRGMFERHLDCIGRHFRFVSLDELGERLLSGVPFTERVAAVTFDDGYHDVYEHAYPVLKRKGIPGAVFVVTDLVGRSLWQIHDRLYHLVAKAFATWDDPRRELCGLLSDLGLPGPQITRPPAASRSPLLAVSALLPVLSQTNIHRVMDGLEASVGNGFYDIPKTLTWPMLAEMRRNGIIVGSHTRTHVRLPMESPEIVAEELEGSKRELEQQLGGPIDHFAYPDGQFTGPVVAAVARAGYRFAYTACHHSVPEQSRLTIGRLLLWEESSVDTDRSFSPAVLKCQAHDLWPPARRCARVHNA